MSRQSSSRIQLCTNAALFSLCASCFFIPFATSLLSLFSVLTLLFWLFSGRIRSIPFLLKSHPAALIAMLLMILFVVSLLYTPTEFDYALRYLKKYRELLFIPLIISLVQGNEIIQKRCEYSFIAGCIVLMLISYAMFFSIIPAARYGNSIVYHITHSFFIALLAFWAIQKAFDLSKYWFIWLIVFILSAINLFYIATGRTGMLVFLCLMILFVIQRLSLKLQILGILLLTLLLATAFATSDIFRSRSSIALKEIQNYQYGASRTSLGMRFDWWVNSIKLIQEKPIFGHGVGSFTTEHNKLIEGTRIKKTDNPHCEYLLIGVQLGLVGLALFIGLFFTMMKLSLSRPKPIRYYSQGVVVAMAIGCIMNSFLFDTHQGHFFAFLSAIYLADM